MGINGGDRVTELDNIHKNIQNHLLSTNVVLGDFLNSVNVLIVYSKQLEKENEELKKQLKEKKKSK